MTIYVLTHEYSDRSAFTICGVTQSIREAEIWEIANEENHVYAADPTAAVRHAHQGLERMTFGKAITK